MKKILAIRFTALMLLSILCISCDSPSIPAIKGDVQITAEIKATVVVSAGIDEPTRETIEKAINTLGSAPAAWQSTMNDTITKLGEIGTDASKKILLDVQSAYSTALGNTESAVFCGVDFIGRRVKEKLQEILDKALGRPQPTILPVICSIVASPTSIIGGVHIDVGVTQLVTYYGYDFLDYSDKKFTVDLESGTGAVVASNFREVQVLHNYEMSINLQGVDYKILENVQEPKLVLKWGDQAVSTGAGKSEIAILLPTKPTDIPALPACQKQDKLLVPSPQKITYDPPHTGSGDKDFATHGPDMQVRVRITMDKSSVKATIYVHARETMEDHTEAEGSTTITISPIGWPGDWLPKGYAVRSIRSATSFDEAIPFSQTDQPFTVDYGQGGPVNTAEYRGDRTGEDVGDGPEPVYTGVTVTLNQIDINLVQTANCTNPQPNTLPPDVIPPDRYTVPQ